MPVDILTLGAGWLDYPRGSRGETRHRTRHHAAVGATRAFPPREGRKEIPDPGEVPRRVPDEPTRNGSPAGQAEEAEEEGLNSQFQPTSGWR